MKKAIYFIGLAFALLLAAASCQKAPFLTFNGQKSFTFKDTGGSETITFSCNRVWTAKSSESWVTVSPAQGDANEEGVRVTITCAANTTYDPRNATVTIMSEGLTETISVSQDTNYGLLSDPTTFNLTNAAQTIEVEVKANVEYSIAIDDACKDWISQAGTKALSSTKLSFNIAANEGYDDREGKITISQKGSSTSVQPQVITVKQSQTNGLFITTPEYALSNESHDLTIEVKANVSYEVTPEVDWIKYEASSTKALSTTTFTLKVDKNETYDQRVGTVKVKGGGLEGIITITQAENLGLFVSPTEVQISKDAQEVEVEVNTNVDYDIVIPEEAKGMITTVKTEGGETKALVAKKIKFDISENTKYEEREASVTFKQKDGSLCGTYCITQAQTDYLSIKATKDSLSYEGGLATLTVVANVPYNVKVVDDIDWVSIAQEALEIDSKDGLTSYEYKFKIEPNESIVARYASVYVQDEAGIFNFIFTVAQGGVPIINFADKYVKKICVKNFDSNADGEVSILEAARVENIDGREISVSGSFFDPYTVAIESFDELQYFTSLKRIPERFFAGCSNLISVVLPKSIEVIGSLSFIGTGISMINLPEGLSIIEQEAFELCNNLKEIIFPESLEVIKHSAFHCCSELSKVVFPVSMSVIENNAFDACNKLEFVRLPEIEVIEDYAFSGVGIKHLLIPEGVTLIEAGAFSNCSNISTIELPSTIIAIGNKAFEGLSNLETVLSNALEAPIINTTTFDNINSKAELLVPIGAIEDYSEWAQYFGGGVLEMSE